MDAQLSGNAPRRTRQTQQEGGENPVRQRLLALVEQGVGEVIEGALAGLLFTAVALQSGLVVVGAPRTNVVALTPRTLEGTSFPSQRVDVGVTLVDVAEVVYI